MKVLLVLFLAISSFEQIRAARLARNCKTKWTQNLQCYKNGVNRAAERDSSFPVPSDTEKRRLEKAVDNCFMNTLKCKKSPIPTTQQAKDRQDCFTQTKKNIQGQLQQCVKRTIDDFIMPDDPYDPSNDWNYRVLGIQNAIKFPLAFCGIINKKELQNCVNNLGYDFNKRVPNKLPPYVCQTDADCWFNWGADCQNTWEYQVIPQLCQCSQDAQKQKIVKTAQDQYKSCLTARGQTAARDDPVLKWIDNYYRGQCTNAQNHPCKREREAANKRAASQRSG